mgnify:CR=1
MNLCDGCPFASRRKNFIHDKVTGSDYVVVFEKPAHPNMSDPWDTASRREVKYKYLPLTGDGDPTTLHLRRCTVSGSASETRDATNHCRVYDPDMSHARAVLALGQAVWEWLGGNKPFTDWVGMNKQ